MKYKAILLYVCEMDRSQNCSFRLGFNQCYRAKKYLTHHGGLAFLSMFYLKCLVAFTMALTNNYNMEYAPGTRKFTVRVFWKTEKENEASFYHSSSTESDSFSENSKSIDKVSKLFSCLLKNPESTLITDKPTTNVTNASSELLPAKNECVPNELPNHDTRISKSPTPKETFDFNLPSNCSVHSEVDRKDFKTKRSLAASCETIVIDHSKCTSTPFNSKIPVLHPRSDPLYYEEPRREQGLKLVNDSNLKKICSNSKIPVSMKRPSTGHVPRVPFTPYAQNYHRRPPEVDRAPPMRNDRGVASGRYTHVKSKLAAYIHRPTKMDILKSSQSKSPNDRRIKLENTYPNFCEINRVSSRTSLDTYTCEFKTPLPDLNCSDCAKTEDAAKNHQRAREHFELALEHNRIKIENEKIVAEHRRMVSKHRQLMLEHEEKANEHTLKAIAHVLNRIT